MDLLSSKTSDENTNIVTCFSVIKSFVKCFDTSHSSFGFVTITIKFDLITSWEVIEHIKLNDLGLFFDNIKNHMHSSISILNQ